MATLHENQYAFVVIPRWILLRMRNVSDKFVKKRKHTHFMFSNSPPRKSCRLRDNVEKYWTAEQATDDNIIRRMRIVWWMNKATDTRNT